MKKSIFALFLALCMVMTLLPATALADGETITPNTEWYNESNNEFTITTAEQLAGLAKLVNEGNSFSGKTITLGADIDLAGKEWTPIGQSGKAFKGTFVGTGFTVSNVSINDDTLDYAGLFGLMEAPGKLQNVTINNADITAKSSAGVLAGSAFTGTVDGCKVTGLIHVTAYYKVGGMAGEGYADFTNCSVIASAGSTVTGVYKEPNLEGDNVGGLIGYRGEGNGVETTGCSVSGISVTGTRKVAGLIGSAFTDNQIEKCTVSDIAVSSNATEEYISENISSAGIGGIVGVYTEHGDSNGTMSSCEVENVSLSSANPGVSMGYLTGGMRGKDEIEDLPTSENWSQSDNQITGSNSGGNTGCFLVDGVFYSSLSEAIIAAAGTDEKTVEIKANVTIDSWNQTWNMSGITINGNNCTLTVNSFTASTLDKGFIISQGDCNIKDLTIDFSSFTTMSTYCSAIIAHDGDVIDNVTIKAPANKYFYGINVVGNQEDTDELVTIKNCKFIDCYRGISLEPNVGTIVSRLESLVIENCEFENCEYASILYARNTTFTGNKVDSGKLNIMHPETAVDGNTFTNGTRVQFFANPQSFVKNIFDETSYLEMDASYVDGLKIDVSENYWGGGAPSEKQLGNVAAVGADIYYVDPSMDENDLNTYVPPYTVTIVYNNGAENEVSHHEFGDIITLPTPTNSGYIFLGWRSGDATYKADEKVTITADTTFTAVWGNLPDVKPSEPSEPETPVFPFYDVTVRDWYYNAVKYVYEKSLMDGVDVGVFAPNDTLTRAMVWTIIARAEGVDTTGGATWYAKAQEWVTAKGISDGENPNAAITRQELVTMLYRLAGEPAVSGTITAPDAASVSSWAADAMTWAMNIGLVEGDENGAVTPTATATRAQAAALIMRYLEA